MSRMTKKQQKTLVRILAGAVLFAAAVALSKTLPALAGWWALPVYLVPYLVVGEMCIRDRFHAAAGDRR